MVWQHDGIGWLADVMLEVSSEREDVISIGDYKQQQKRQLCAWPVLLRDIVKDHIEFAMLKKS